MTLASLCYTHHNVAGHCAGSENIEREEDLFVVTAQQWITSAFCMLEAHLKNGSHRKESYTQHYIIQSINLYIRNTFTTNWFALNISKP